MKIGVAQTRPVKGDIQRNIEEHKRLIRLAVSHGADALIFPELSITGYEPELTKDLATTPDDSRFDDFQELSDCNQITIGVGVPIKSAAGIQIGMVIFQPHQSRQTYAKQHLHPDEYPYFVSGQQSMLVTNDQTNIGLAICYELSVPEHAEEAFNSGANLYVASVAKSLLGVEKATERLSVIARRYSMPVLMANCIGYCDNFESGGKTAIWNSNGVLVGQLNDTNEGILILDTDTGEVVEKILEHNAVG